MLKKVYIQKAVWYLESEIELLKLIILQTRQPPAFKSESYKPKVYFIPKSDGLGIIGMGEIATSLQLTGEFFDENGNPSALSHISGELEQAFNFRFGNIYKVKGRIFGRKTYNLTKALDYLRNLVQRKSCKNNKNKDEKR